MLLEKLTKPSLKCLKIDKREKLMKMGGKSQTALQEPDGTAYEEVCTWHMPIYKDVF